MMLNTKYEGTSPSDFRQEWYSYVSPIQAHVLCDSQAP